MKDRKVGLLILAVIILFLLGLQILSQHKLGAVAYIQQGDVWVKTLPDGKPKQLTNDGLNNNPRWSPTGKWVLFRKNNQLWVSSSEGNIIQKIHDHVKEFVWLPNKDVIIYTTTEEEMILTSPMVHDSRKLIKRAPDKTLGEGITIGKLRCSPDGRYVAFERQKRTSASLIAQAGIWQVFLLNASAKPIYETEISESEQVLGAVPRLASWLPEAKGILFWRGSESAAIEADGVPLYKIRTKEGQAEPVNIGNEVVLVSPNTVITSQARSQEISTGYFGVIVGSGRETWSNKQLVKVNEEKNNLVILSEGNQAVISANIASDADRMVYSASAIGISQKNLDKDYRDKVLQILNQRRIWVVDFEGGKPRQLTNDNRYRDENPLWSANGEYVLFARLDATAKKNQASLWLMRDDGNELKQIIKEISPAPDGFGFYGYINWGQYYDFWDGNSS